MKKTLASIVVAFAVELLPVVSQAQGIEVTKAFSPARDTPLTLTRVTADEGGWRIDPTSPGAVRLFEVAGSTCEACRLIYRAKVKTRNLSAPALLEMWVRVPEKGEFFSRGFDQTVSGSVEWTSVELAVDKGRRAAESAVALRAGSAARRLDDAPRRRGSPRLAPRRQGVRRERGEIAMRRALVVLHAAALAHALVPVAVADDHVQLPATRPPVAVPAADVHDGPAPLRVCFDASTSYHPEGKAFGFRWDFGDGRGTASEPSACHVYIEPGLYAAMLTVTDDQGLESSRVLIVSIHEVP